MTAARRIDTFWAGYFGVSASALGEPGTHVVPHVGLGDYAGVWFFVRDGACIVSAPASWCDRIREALVAHTFDAVLSEEGLTALFGPAYATTVGPAYQGWLDPQRFEPTSSPNVRPIEEADRDATLAFRAACGEDDWQDGDLKLDAPGAFGWFEADDLLAAASLTHWDDTTVGPGLLVRPDRRRAGCGTAACSAAVAWSLQAGLTLTYQTLMENTGALRIAQSLGFEQYATHIAVRLRGQPEGEGRGDSVLSTFAAARE